MSAPVGKKPTKPAAAARSTTDGADRGSLANPGGNPAQREEVIKLVLVIVRTLVGALGLTKEEACRMVRWAAHVIEGSKEEL